MLCFFVFLIFPAPNKPRISWEAVSYHEIELRWSKPKPANGKLKKYKIYCADNNNNHSVSIRTKRRFVLVSHLKPATLYKCTLQASNHPHAQQNPMECITSVDVEPMQTLILSAYRNYSFFKLCQISCLFMTVVLIWDNSISLFVK